LQSTLQDKTIIYRLVATIMHSVDMILFTLHWSLIHSYYSDYFFLFIGHYTLLCRCGAAFHQCCWVGWWHVPSLSGHRSRRQGYNLCPTHSAHFAVFILQRLWGATLLHSHKIPHEGNLGSRVGGGVLYFIMNGKINGYCFSNEMVGALIEYFLCWSLSECREGGTKHWRILLTYFRL
jgi:hypothetical protein